ncbi:MAG: Transcriptional regulator MraZ [Dehalococcoidia bacterium]|nr:Transcriptional regulator MraZ [Chloroflexota bacterium]MBT9166224.1 Transcriptional regulator MraZ [Chloroflexota bacterium]
MILGEYEYRIDQKGRVAIPAKLRKAFQDGLVLTRGFDRCILAYPLPEWQRICERFADLPTTRDKNRRLIRITFASAFSAELDGQGRVALPSPLREYAGIKDVAVMAGGNKYLEIWSKESWENEKLLMDERAWQLAEGMELR